MCIRCKTEERLDQPRLYPSFFKPHTHKRFILRHCPNIVYLCFTQSVFNITIVVASLLLHRLPLMCFAYPEMTLHLLICISKMAATQLSAFLYDLYRR
jgi:hypothetical protein